MDAPFELFVFNPNGEPEKRLRRRGQAVAGQRRSEYRTRHVLVPFYDMNEEIALEPTGLVEVS
jgi:hypothetical protein